jgi:mutator protein MutT
VEPIPVIAAVLERDGRFLVGQRPDHKRHGGLWEFPGGKVDPGESWLDAVRRELAEELAMDVVAQGRLLLSVRDQDSPFVIHFLEVAAAGDPTPLEHSAVGWFTPEEMGDLRLAPADARFVTLLRQGE